MFFATKLFFLKHKSFPLNRGGGRKSKDIKTMEGGVYLPFFGAGGVFVYLAVFFTYNRTKFFGRDSNPSLCSGDCVSLGP